MEMKMKIIFYILTTICLMSCQSNSGDNLATPDFTLAKLEILKLEGLQREYHITKNARDFVNLFSEDFISVSRGSIDLPSREDSFEMFDAYFNRVEFIVWDDVEEPVVRFSDDASMAYVAVDKLVVVNRPGEDGVMQTDSTKFAWLLYG